VRLGREDWLVGWNNWLVGLRAGGGLRNNWLVGGCLGRLRPDPTSQLFEPH
jgi:hypothetical protein